MFAAEEPLARREVALKVIEPEIAAWPEAKGRFLREARMAAGLTHDHIVTIFRVDEEPGVPFLVMPLMPGETLHEQLERDEAAARQEGHPHRPRNGEGISGSARGRPDPP